MMNDIVDPNISKLILNDGTPNIIGNVEDISTPQLDPAHPYPSVNAMNKDDQMSAGGDSTQFKDITGTLVRNRRTKSKNRQTL